MDSTVDDQCSLSAGDTAFMMFASTVVMMQTPAMGMAQAGMIRRKNSLSMLMQVLFGMAIGSLLWALIGFSLSFGESANGFIGNPASYALLLNVPITTCIPELADSIPGLLFVAFQMMFALMTPLIVTGSWTEKMTFEAFLIFIVLWPILSYYPLVHWFWNPEGWLNSMGIADFAGGMVIHLNVGMAGLVVSYLLQRRKLHSLALSHHNLPLSFAGAALVWSGWYSFNGGSALKADFQAAGALVNTHLSACAGALVWSLWNYRSTKMWSLVECISGAFAGLGGITAGSGFVEPWAAVVIGSIAGTASFWSVRFFKDYLRLDDVLDVTSLQGTAGCVGSLLVGFFATADMQPGGDINGLFYGGGGRLLGVQALGVVVTLLWSGFWTLIIMLVMKYTVGIDISPRDAELGLDITQIGEQAYDQRLDLLHDIGHEALVGLLNEACCAGDVEDVKTLIVKQGADPEMPDYDGRRPAHLAAAHGCNSVLDYLYTHHKINLNCVDNFGGTPLLDALRHRKSSTVKWLKERGASLDDLKIQIELFEAVAKGDTKELGHYLDAGVDVNVTDYDHRTPLMVAASNGHPVVIKQLLDAGADINKIDRWGRTALDSALIDRQADCAAILRSGCDTEESEPSESWQDNYVDVEAPTLRNRLNASSTKRSSVRTLLTFSAKGRDLNMAASLGDVEELKRLVEKGSDPTGGDYDGRTPLHLAAAGGHLEAVQYLCSQEKINVNVMDRWHQTPAEEAKRNGFDKVSSWLYQNGAVKINRSLGPALCAAAAKGDLSKIMELQQDGSDLNAGDYDSRTAMHLAACNGHMDVVKFLVSHGARANIQDRYGGTPLDDAKREGKRDIEEYLNQYQKSGV